MTANGSSLERQAQEVEDALVQRMHRPKSWDRTGKNYTTYCGLLVRQHMIGSWGRIPNCLDCDHEAEKAAETLIRRNKARP